MNRNHPLCVLWRACNHFGLTHLLPDRLYLSIPYRLYFDRKLDLKNPKSFNEKLQWLKLNDRNTEYSKLVDKYEVKKYIAEVIGAEYIIPTLGVWENFDDIQFELLPEQFVLKCTHDSGGLVICNEKKTLNIEAAKEKIERSLKRNYYYDGREWPYKNVAPRIIAEPYIVDSKGELNDYKFFCFNGTVKCMKVDYGRYIDHHANYYDKDMNLLPFGESAYPREPDHKIEKPACYEKMVELAERLSKPFIFIRVDFYNVDGKIYFGELTFFPASGFGEIEPKEWDLILGDWIQLPIDN